MKLPICIAALTALVSIPALAQNAPQPPADSPQGTRGNNVPAFWVRPGYRVDLVAEKFGQARFLETDGKGTIFVSQPDEGGGSIIALTDADGDGVYENKKVLSTGKRRSHAMQYFDGMLYFATPTTINRLDPANPEKAETIAKIDLANDGGHWYRSLLITGDSLYTSIGDPQNIGDETATDREKIWKYPFDAKTGKLGDRALFATGIRNTEKLRMRPGTTEIYGCDHGSDNLGGRYGEQGGGPITDMFPPCEFNHYIEGFDYGHPFITGLGLPRPEYAQRADILQKVENNTPPAWMFGAHWAPNGWTFVSTDKLVPKGDALIALHGSWNSRHKVGYRIEHICFDAATGRPYGAQMLVGTLAENGNDSLARPVDCLEMPDGSVLFSTDQGNRIYRITKQ